MKQKIYIAGKVTGLPKEEVTAKFEKAEKHLEVKGYEVVNPIKVVNNREATWTQAMAKCVIALQKCSCIYLLDDYKNSKGAQLEFEIAIRLKLKVIYQNNKFYENYN